MSSKSNAVKAWHGCRMSDLLYKLTSLKFQEPSQGEEIIKDHCDNVRMELADRFRALEEEFR